MPAPAPSRQRAHRRLRSTAAQAGGQPAQGALGDAPNPARRQALSPAHTPAPALLRLIWLASPALPVGGFSYSEVLESALDAGLVLDEASAGRWLHDQLVLVQQRAEMPLLASAIRAWQRHDGPRLLALNDWSVQSRESAELRQQTLQMGRSLADWVRQRHPAEPRLATLQALRPAPTWPLSFALAAAVSGAPLREALLAFGFGWAENMVQAAVKLVPLGQSAGQRLLGQLAEGLPAAVDEALRLSQLGDAQRLNFAPMLALLSARHEAQYSRLFRS